MLSPGLPGSAQAGLLQRQSDSLRQMLSFNEASKDSSSEPQWKVLVYDHVGQAILSPLFSVKELRDLGVTLHILLHSERDPIPEVPAIYFCQPTDQNMKRIGQDLEQALYGSYHFNFISPISRQKLEDLAAVAIQCNAASQIKKVYDQYVNFISLDNEMFVLRHHDSSDMSFYALNRSQVTDTQMEDILAHIVDGLFSVCVTLATIPIIRCPKGNAAEAVATRLDKKLRENLRDNRNSLFQTDGLQTPNFNFHRVLLVILDRQIDLATPLHHTWTYQALAHDVLDYSLNRVTMTEPEASGGVRKKPRICDLDQKDQFWMSHKGSPFPVVAERIQEELEDYRSREDDIKKMKHDIGLEGGSENDAALGFISDNTQRLTSAVSSLPALLEKKRLIDMHTSIATAILDQIKLRKLDLFFELEEKIMSKSTLDRTLMQIFEDAEAGTPEDKMRLFIIYYLCSQQVTEAEVDQYAKALQLANCDLAPLQYLKRWKSFSKMTTSTDFSGGGTKTVSMFSKLMQQSSSFVMEGVKNLVVKKHQLPVTKIVDELMELRPGPYQDDYRYFDPKVLRSQNSLPRTKSPFQEAIVFVVGGGNYIEYQNLMELSSTKGTSMALSPSGYSAALSPVNGGNSKRNIVYGSSTLVNANQMMDQLAKLGQEL